MNVSNSSQAQPVSAPQTVDKRAQLQSMLLRKSVETQQAEAASMMREAEGKGQSIDIRC